jgi:dihydrofolate reductase
MRKIIASIFLSLDGFIVGPGEDMSWVRDNFNDEMGKYAGDLQNSMDTILLGRVTYEIMNKVWPFQTESTWPGADRMNSATKVVFSKSLDKVEWGKYNNARLVHDILPDGINSMKRLLGKDMVIYGSASIVREFTRLGLIDEYQLLVHPVILGAGKLLFKDFTSPVRLDLTGTVSFKNGVVVLYYAPAGK